MAKNVVSFDEASIAALATAIAEVAGDLLIADTPAILGIDAVGVDTPADDFIFQAPRSTGNAIGGGAVIFEVSRPGASGVTPQTRVQAFRAGYPSNVYGDGFGVEFAPMLDEDVRVYFGDGTGGTPSANRQTVVGFACPSSVAHPGDLMMDLQMGDGGTSPGWHFGFRLQGDDTRQAIRFVNGAGLDEKAYIDKDGVIGAHKWFEGPISVDPAATADLVTLGGYDRSAGHRALAIGQEDPVVTSADTASTHALPVRINGANFKILLVAG